MSAIQEIIQFVHTYNLPILLTISYLTVFGLGFFISDRAKVFGWFIGWLKVVEIRLQEYNTISAQEQLRIKWNVVETGLSILANINTKAEVSLNFLAHKYDAETIGYLESLANGLLKDVKKYNYTSSALGFIFSIKQKIIMFFSGSAK